MTMNKEQVAVTKGMNDQRYRLEAPGEPERVDRKCQTLNRCFCQTSNR